MSDWRGEGGGLFATAGFQDQCCQLTASLFQHALRHPNVWAMAPSIIVHYASLGGQASIFSFVKKTCWRYTFPLRHQLDATEDTAKQRILKSNPELYSD
jgi:hypothetical protein